MIAGQACVAEPARYVSTMHGEPTRVDVYSRIPNALLQTSVMGQSQLLKMRCGTVSISREGTCSLPQARRYSTFILQVAGRSTFRHYGNLIELDSGDFTLCDNSTPYLLELGGVSEVILFRVQNDALSDAVPLASALCGRRLRRDFELASAAAAMANDLAQKDFTCLSPETGERASRHLLDLLATSFSALLDESDGGSALMAGRYWKVKLFIEEHLRDPALGPAMIARQLRVSDRYLRLIFAQGGEAPAAYILRRRLEECAAQIRDPHWLGRTITDIAFNWGFNSASHFTRSFRARFGHSPREYRQQFTRTGPALQ